MNDFDATSGPRDNGMKCSTLASKGQRSTSHEAKGTFGDTAGLSFSTSLGGVAFRDK